MIYRTPTNSRLFMWTNDGARGWKKKKRKGKKMLSYRLWRPIQAAGRMVFMKNESNNFAHPAVHDGPGLERSRLPPPATASIVPFAALFERSKAIHRPTGTAAGVHTATAHAVAARIPTAGTRMLVSQAAWVP